MNRRVALILATTLILLAGVGWWLTRPSAPPPAAPPAAGEENAEESGLPETVTLEPSEADPVKIVPARWTVVQEVLQVTGKLRADPNRSAVVTARVSGFLRSIEVNVGQRVAAGQTVAVIDSPEVARARGDYAVALRQHQVARANLERERDLARAGQLTEDPIEEARGRLSDAQAAVREAQARLELARRNRDRAESLVRENIISRREFEVAHADYKVAEAQVLGARQKLTQEQSHYEHERRTYQGRFLARRALQQLEGEVAEREQAVLAARKALDALGAAPGEGGTVAVPAPIGGVVINRQATPGQSLEAGAAVLTVLDNRTLWAVLEIYEKDIPKVRAGTPVVIQPTTGGRRHAARVTYVSPRLDAESRTLDAWARVDNASGTLQDGLFVRATVDVGGGRKSVVIPEDALQEVEGKTVVFVETEPHTFRMVGVERGQETADGVEIRSGLKAGSKVATTGSFVVKSEFLKGTLGGED